MLLTEIKKIIRKECRENGIEFYHGRWPMIKWIDGFKSNGYFHSGDETIPPKLAVANNSHTMITLIHEYCHMQQFLENTKIWNDISKYYQLWDWVAGGSGFTKRQLDKSLQACYLLELDCEKRTIEFHKKWKTGINIQRHIQQCNAYTLFYFYMRENRCWYSPGKEPYSLKKVWSKMPKTFNFDREKTYKRVSHLFASCI